MKKTREIDYKRRFATSVKGASAKPKKQPVQPAQSDKEMFDPNAYKNYGDVFAPISSLPKGSQPEWVVKKYGKNKTTE